ncbi:MAG: hypothetical protein Q8K96_05200 [Rubrivivax sp.]|nr:hypothetical protein [Rubrivivax sp.]
MSELRALLLTDVVDSTLLSERLGDEAMAAVWAAHDRVARDLLPAWRGREIDKTDGMLLLFDAASDALHYALAYHRALAGLPVALKARAGLHVGPVILRENGAADVARGAKPLEVDGLAKPTAARVMSLARGGQTLLTPEARAAVGETALPLQSHGHWVMKGVSAPLELFEAGEDPSAFAAPPDGEKVYRVVRVGERWLPTREIPNNLPQQATSFIGRERELDELKARLGSARLVTLLGMGGLGKTRLSLQVAAEAMAEFPDGVWFLDLSPIRDPALVAGEAASVLGVREEPGRPLIQTLCAHLASRRVLLVFDNCEHLIQPAADLAHALLRAAPGVRIMASSREALHVPGEQVCPILPLPVPGRGDGLDALSRSTAVRLFVERAQSHRPAFTLNEREAPAVAELVARLEGIPLALELAAARVRSLSVAEINKRLADRYQLLTGGSRVLQERQQTLRALVDWSYELLPPGEQTLFSRLAVFVGGFDLAAAEAVCGAAPLDSPDVMDRLASLVEKSLVMMEERDDSVRYRMLETLRDYAGAKLAQSADQAATAARHNAHYLSLAKALRLGLVGPEQGPWIARGETELDNLRAALSLALAGGVDPVIAVKLAVALQGFWQLRGYATEGRAAVRAALALPAVQASDVPQAHALYVGAVLALSQSDHAEATQQLETCLALRRRLGNPVEIAATLSTLCVTLLQGGQARVAAEREREAMLIFQQLGDRKGEAIGHEHLAQCALFEGDDEEAAAHLERGLAVAREIAYRESEAACQLLRAELAWEAQDAVQARQCGDESLRICQESGDKRGAANAHGWLARLALDAADAPEVQRHLALAMRVFCDFEMREPLLGSLEDAARAAALFGDDGLAVALIAAVAQSRERLNLRRAPRAERRCQAHQQALRSRLGDAGFDAGCSEGGRWTVDEACSAAFTALRPPALA